MNARSSDRTLLVPRPPKARVVAALWFPFFFAIAAALSFMTANHEPRPSALTLDVSLVGQGPTAHALTVEKLSKGLNLAHPAGFVVHEVSKDQARQDVAGRSAVGALVANGDTGVVYEARAASSITAQLVQTSLTSVAVGVNPRLVVTTQDLAPLASGDSGVAMLFFLLPCNLVGLIQAIVLLQLPMLSMRRKLLFHALSGAFATAVTYAIALDLKIIPNHPAILGFGFVLTQVIGWLATGLAPYVKQQFLPLGMTFVVLLGVPSSGGSIPSDLMPEVFKWINGFMPFAQLVDIGRDVLYFHSRALGRPALILVCWLVAAGVILCLGERRHRRHLAVQAREAWEVEREIRTGVQLDELSDDHVISGSVRTNTGSMFDTAVVMILDDSGSHVTRSTTDRAGNFTIRRISAGVHHVLVTAKGFQPVMQSVAVRTDARTNHLPSS